MATVTPRKRPNGCMCPNCNPNRSTNYLDYLPPNHIGRPIKYNPKECIPKAIEILARGKGLANLCKEFHLSHESLNVWRKKYPELSEAINIGLALSESWWTDSGQENLGNQKFNAFLWNMNMKNRFNWNDRKPSYAAKEIENYEGTFDNKLTAINDKLKKGQISPDEHTCMMESLLKEAKILETAELEKKIDIINEKLGIKKA